MVRRALRLEALTLGWLGFEAAVAVGAALAARSVSLMAFGVDSAIELASAALLLWRLEVELRRGAAFSEAVERLAGRLAALLLFGLALYIAAAGIGALWRREAQAFSWPGLGIAAAAVPVMLWLARRKRRLAALLHSPALRADSAEAVACAGMSLVVAAGMLAQRFFDFWWIDAATSLPLLWFVLREGREAWNEA